MWFAVRPYIGVVICRAEAFVQCGRQCNGIALNNLDKAGHYLGTGIGVVFVFIGRRIVDGKRGVSGRGTSPGSVSHRAKKGIKLKLLSSISTQLTQASYNESVLIRKNLRRDTGVTPRVTSHLASSARGRTPPHPPRPLPPRLPPVWTRPSSRHLTRFPSRGANGGQGTMLSYRTVSRA